MKCMQYSEVVFTPGLSVSFQNQLATFYPDINILYITLRPGSNSCQIRARPAPERTFLGTYCNDRSDGSVL